MQKLYIILAGSVLLFVAVFAGMNSAPVSIKFLFMGELKPPAYLLIIVCFLSGTVLMALLDLGRQFRSWSEIKNLKKQIKSLEEERGLLKKRVDDRGAEKPEPEKPS